MWSAGLLNEIVVFKEPTLVRGDFGGNATIYTPIITTRARIVNDNGNRNVEETEMVWNYTKTFVVRYYHDIKDNYLITWNGEDYRILNIDKDRDKQQITIKTEKVNE